ncbi:MAG: alanine--tRNA ligase [Gammaproteobacteria bacterium]
MAKNNSTNIRKSFLDYFVKHNHTEVSSSSLVPGNDPTLLFTNAGMVQFKDAFLGNEKRTYSRATSSQKCLRAGGKHNDLENVGYTSRHHTFFEMLGNFSFGDYFKEEAIGYAWEYVTKELQLPSERLWVTTHQTDNESKSIWLNGIGIDPKRLVALDDKDNFWAMGDTGPCGPCSEIFYDYGDTIKGGPPGSKDADGDRFVEIWNIVFMQFERDTQGQLSNLPAPSVDTGMGLERISAIMSGVTSNYDTDLFVPLIEEAKKITRQKEFSSSLNVIADHLRAISFLIADGVLPGSDGRGYVLRRILRRAARHGYLLGMKDPFLFKLVDVLINNMGEAYKVLNEKSDYIKLAIKEEEERFGQTLSHGMKIFNAQVDLLKEQNGKTLDGETVFQLYDTYGFPEDLTKDLARSFNLKIDEEGFKKSMAEQKKRARESMKFNMAEKDNLSSEQSSIFFGYEKKQHNSEIKEIFLDSKIVQSIKEDDEAVIVLSETPFYAESGGQVGDTGIIECENGTFEVLDTQKKNEAIFHIGKVKNGQIKGSDGATLIIDKRRRAAIAGSHSATHLLHAGLRKILGDHVQQRGSLVEAGRLRFDFSHNKPVTQDQIESINQYVNDEIANAVSTKISEMPYKNAISSGALAFFDEKYEDQVRVLEIGTESKELCGGTHVTNTSEIGLFEIYDESSIASGVRRIEAYTGQLALEHLKFSKITLREISNKLGAGINVLLPKIDQLVQSDKEHIQLIKKEEQVRLKKIAETINKNKKKLSKGSYALVEVENLSVNSLRDLCDYIHDLDVDTAIIAVSKDKDQLTLVCSVHKSLAKQVDARDLVTKANELLNGRGGGKPTFAQSGSREFSKLRESLKILEANLIERLS